MGEVEVTTECLLRTITYIASTEPGARLPSAPLTLKLTCIDSIHFIFVLLVRTTTRTRFPRWSHRKRQKPFLTVILCASCQSLFTTLVRFQKNFERNQLRSLPPPIARGLALQHITVRRTVSGCTSLFPLTGSSRSTLHASRSESKLASSSRVSSCSR